MEHQTVFHYIPLLLPACGDVTWVLQADWNVDELNILHRLDSNVNIQFVSSDTIWSVVAGVANY
jgi:hypothetical protein